MCSSNAGLSAYVSPRFGAKNRRRCHNSSATLSIQKMKRNGKGALREDVISLDFGFEATRKLGLLKREGIF